MNKLLLLFLLLLFTNQCCKAELLNDFLVDDNLDSVNIEKPETNTNYNYESTVKIPVKLNISEKISTKKDGIYDAQPLTFYVKKDVRYKGNLIIKKGSVFTAIVETYMTKGMNGIPGTIIVDKFHSEFIDSNKIKGTYIKKGLNLSLLVFPVKWALTPIPGAGSFTNFIVGGNASISPKDDVTIYYYPYWSAK